LVLPLGITVSHWTEDDARTGCAVVLAEGGTVAGVDVCGGAPGTLGRTFW
jgi:L-aminopeptidase/D-esterase-like protein